MARNPGVILARLKPADMRVLKVIERGSSRYMYVPLDYIERHSRLPPPRVLESIDRLNSEKLIVRRIGSTLGYKLTYTGLDVIALNNLVARGVVESIGERIGVGKEGNIYLAWDPAGNPIVVKFHREGRRSFQSIRRKRRYAEGLPRKSWIQLAKLVGEREFKILAALKDRGALVPEPIAYNRNTVVQEYIPGVELYRIRSIEKSTAEEMLSSIVRTLKIAYQEVGIVHGDLSEYNILVTEDYKPYIIDWPQYVYREDPESDTLLERDIEYIAGFFKKRFGIKAEPGEILREVKGE
ncbi:MAG: serine/threonine protein kinase [Desulfurococcales archaeon]|nr:serine/threonine protein kinase [Desulfurococcales archaeon]